MKKPKKSLIVWGIINNGKLLLVEDKVELMQKLGSKQLSVELRQPIDAIPESLEPFNLELSDNGSMLVYQYDTRGDRTGITTLMQAINSAGLTLRDIHTSQSSLEDIFVNLVTEQP